MKTKELKVMDKSDLFFFTASNQAKCTFFYPTRVGHYFYKPYYSLFRNSYDSFLIMYIANGSCKVTINNKTQLAKSGQVVFLDCYKPHEYSSTEGWEALWIHFDGITAREYYNLVTNSSGNVITLKDTLRFHKNLKKIYDCFALSQTINEAKVSNYITNMLTELIIDSNEPSNNNSHSEMIDEVIAYINEHLDQNLSLENLSAQISLSPYYFSRIFKKEIGMPPHEYILTARINTAKFYLKTTSITIKKISLIVGFSSESSFCTTFKKRERMSPSSYRNTNNTIIKTI